MREKPHFYRLILVKEEVMLEIFTLPTLLMSLNGLVSVVQLILMILGIACCIKYLRSR